MPVSIVATPPAGTYPSTQTISLSANGFPLVVSTDGSAPSIETVSDYLTLIPDLQSYQVVADEGGTLYRMPDSSATNIYKSVDGGTTWESIAISDSFMGIAVPDSPHRAFPIGCCLLAAMDHLIFTKDSGSTWATRSLPIGATSTAIIDRNKNFYTVVNNTDIYKSTDEGITWNKISSVADATVGLFFETDTGKLGIMGHTTNPMTITISDDYGATWGQPFAYSASYMQNHNAVICDGIKYSTYQGFQKSIDGGTTWEDIVPSGEGFPSGSHPVAYSYSSGVIWLAYLSNGILATAKFSPKKFTVSNGVLYNSPLEVSQSSSLKISVIVDGVQESTITLTYEIGSPVASPTATPSSGMYSKYQVISLETTTAGAVVYYTVDGSTPSASSSTAPILLLKAFTLKAIAIKDGQSSEIATFEYSIGDSFMDVVPKRSFSNSIPVRTIYAYDIGNADLRGVVDYYAIKQSIKNIISTPKGTAIRDLTFGTSIYDIIYDIYTDGDEAAIVSSLKSDIESCDSRVTISSHLSTASFNKSTRTLSITLVWSAPLINDQKLVISIPV